MEHSRELGFRSLGLNFSGNEGKARSKGNRERNDHGLHQVDYDDNEVIMMHSSIVPFYTTSTSEC